MTNTFLKPLGDRVVIKVKEKGAQTTNGIYIPNTEASNRGEIIATGPGRILENGESIPVAVHAGDEVIFNPHAGSKIKYEDENYLILHEGEIIAVI